MCRRWHERVAGGAQLDEDPDNLIGELRSGDKPHRFDRPHDALFLPNGDICIADCDNFRLQVVSREGYYMREVPLSGGTSCPTGVADGDNYLYVVEHGAHQVSKLRKSSSSGHRHAVAGSWGGGDGELRHPWGLTVSNKRVYVTDQGNDRVSVFDADKLKWLFSFGSSGSKQGEFSSPRGVCAHEPTTSCTSQTSVTTGSRCFRSKMPTRPNAPRSGSSEAAGALSAAPPPVAFAARLEVRRHEMPRTKLLQQHACLSAPTAVLPSRSLLT